MVAIYYVHTRSLSDLSQPLCAFAKLNALQLRRNTEKLFDIAIVTIGDSGEISVAIPKRAFKVAVWEVGDAIDAIALIHPNVPDGAGFKAGSHGADKQYDHSPYIVTLAAVDRAAGLMLVPELAENGQRILKRTRHVQRPDVEINSGSATVGDTRGDCDELCSSRKAAHPYSFLVALIVRFP